MVPEQEYMDIIKKTFPELNIQDFSILGKGNLAATCLVNKNIVFKITGTSEKALKDTEHKKITGLIDFGAAHFSEPSRDMHYYYGDGARDFLAGYGDNGDTYLVERQKFQAIINFLSNIRDNIESKKSPDKDIQKLLSIL